MQAKIFTVTTQKGGIGKTTTAAVLAQAAAHRGRRVLAIDTDPQGNLTIALDADPRRAGCFEFIQGAPAADTIQTTPQGIDVLGASLDLATLETNRGSARRLQNALEAVQGRYDVVLLDTPATPGELKYNALQASTGLIIPIEADAYNIQSLYQTADMVKMMQKSNPALTITGIIFTRCFDARTNFSKQMQETVIKEAAALNIPYLGAIRHSIAVKEAAGFRLSLYEYAPRCKPAADYLALFDRLYNE